MLCLYSVFFYNLFVVYFKFKSNKGKSKINPLLPCFKEDPVAIKEKEITEVINALLPDYLRNSLFSIFLRRVSNSSTLSIFFVSFSIESASRMLDWRSSPLAKFVRD